MSLEMEIQQTYVTNDPVPHDTSFSETAVFEEESFAQLEEEFYAYPNGMGMTDFFTTLHGKKKIPIETLDYTSVSFYVAQIVEHTETTCVTDIYLCSVDAPRCGQISWDFKKKIYSGQLQILCRVDTGEQEVHLFVEVFLNGRLSDGAKILAKPATIRITPFLKINTLNQNTGNLESFVSKEVQRMLRMQLSGTIDIIFPGDNIEDWITCKNFFQCRYRQEIE